MVDAKQAFGMSLEQMVESAKVDVTNCDTFLAEIDRRAAKRVASGKKVPGRYAKTVTLLRDVMAHGDFR